MRKEYGKVLRDSFSKKMKSLAPEYIEIKVKSQYVCPGERTFCRKVDEHLFCWVVLSPSPKDYDEFTLMIGWSNSGRYPELSPIPSFISPTPDHAEFSEPEYMIRLPELWSRKDDWWVVKEFKPALTIEQLQALIAPIGKEEAESLVLPKVGHAFDKLVEIGIPYLNEYVSFRHEQSR